MSGRGFGYCSGSGAPGYVSAPGPGMGMAWGFGGGRGRGGYGMGLGWGRASHFGPGRYHPWAAAPVAPENQKRFLQQEKEDLEERLRFLEKEIEAMDSPGEES